MKQESIVRTAVRSRDIAIIGYDREKQMLEIAFRGGGVYRYHGVPETIYQRLMESSSHGLYFNREIKDKYRTTKAS